MLKVLIVDDEYMVLKGLEAMIGTQQLFLVQIQTAMDAEDALEKIEKWIPDVVIADVNMPEIDGLQMIELARQRGSRCRFIICTGYDEVEYLHRAIRQQVAEYLLKPIEREILLHKLQELDREKQIENGEMLSLMKTRLLFRQSDTPVLSPEEQCALFPEE
ncbi:MAG: response regulator [Clostridiales bacterium]|nr:response regulator [Clostridiales bacterium]